MEAWQRVAMLVLRPGTPVAAPRTVLGEGGCLPTPGAPRRIELFLQMLAAALPVVPLLDLDILR